MATKNNLKIFNEQWQADVRLKAGDSAESEAIPAHKLVLAARSEVFMKILESDNLKANDVEIETVTMSDMKKEELEAFVEFIYNNRSSLSVNEKKHARSLYLAADKYVILHLRDLCRSHLISSLSPENALDFLELAQIPFDKVLNDAAFGYIKSTIHTIVVSDIFKIFVASNPNLAVEIMKASVTPAGRGYCNRCGLYNSYCYNCKT